MTYEIDAIYNNGAFIPVVPLEIPEGVRVHLRVDEQPAARESLRQSAMGAELE